MTCRQLMLLRQACGRREAAPRFGIAEAPRPGTQAERPVGAPSRFSAETEQRAGALEALQYSPSSRSRKSANLPRSLCSEKPQERESRGQTRRQAVATEPVEDGEFQGIVKGDDEESKEVGAAGPDLRPEMVAEDSEIPEFYQRGRGGSPRDCASHCATVNAA